MARTLRPEVVHPRTATEYLDDSDATVRKLLSTGALDQRWVRVRRPVIVTGGELNLAMLDPILGGIDR